MPVPPRPHLLGIDDGPFQKGVDADVPIVGVMMEGPDLVEAIAITRFPVDGDGLTGFLADWVGAQRFRPALQGVLLGGITAAGLGVVDVPLLAERLGLPVVVVNRREPRDEPLLEALRSAGLEGRGELVTRAPQARLVEGGLYAGVAGTTPEDAARLVQAARGKSDLPEPLRLAHLIAAAVARGESRGRP